MTKVGHRMLTGAREALAIARGEHVPGAVVHTPVDVKALRARLGLTQPEFAERYGVPVGSLRDWEQARTAPDGAARTLLAVIESSPRAVEKAVTGLRRKGVITPAGGRILMRDAGGSADPMPPKKDGSSRKAAPRRAKAAG
ncbi:helix-turn-helix domain-containing protein [Roseomonas hellenica]|uniref:Helix-turn-helix domain-containing protein n=1 Tax=Plastoroseomonas hellenica TaxID=2687306 RepID=A0ABS5ESJ5_9PROT|nr:helix-turn-helix domain-containing protein [Plastoroseomonas hellenica]MBR0663274.1 helix-turn-helix domain-containing protein [Plastoroseomonas hellenica]